jgi:hypothetical protein
VKGSGVRRFQRHVRAPAHGDPDVRCRERRGVVDAVADLGDHGALGLQLAHDGLLVLGQQFAAALDPEPSGNGLGRALVVAGEHNGCNSGLLERLDARHGVWARFVAHSDQADDLGSGEEHGDGFALAVEGRHAGALVGAQGDRLGRGLR